MRRRAAVLLGLAALCGLSFWFAATFLKPEHPYWHLCTHFDDDRIWNLSQAILSGNRAEGSRYLVVFGRPLPISFYYHGALPIYLALPFSGAKNVYGLGSATAFYMAAALAAALLLGYRRTRSLPLAALSAALIAAHPAIVKFSTESYAFVPYSVFFVILAFYASLKWFRSRRRRYLFLTALSLGAGLSLQLRFGYAVFAFAAAAAVLGRRIARRIWRGNRRSMLKDITLAGLAFGAASAMGLATAIPVAVLPRLGAAISGNTYLKFDVLQRLRTLPALFRFDDSGGAPWLLIVSAAAVLYLAIAANRGRTHLRAPEKTLLPLLSAFYLLASPLTISDWRTDHLIDFAPLLSLSIACVLSDLARRLRTDGRAIPIAALAALTLVAASFRRPRQPRLDGGGGPASYHRTIGELIQRGIRAPVRSPDHNGMSSTFLRAHSGGRIVPVDADPLISPSSPDSARLCVLSGTQDVGTCGIPRRSDGSQKRKTWPLEFSSCPGIVERAFILGPEPRSKNPARSSTHLAP